MKFLSKFFLVILFGAALQWIFAWWGIALAAFFLGLALASRNGFANFFAGFLGGFCLWAGYAFFLDNGGASDLVARVGRLFSLPAPELVFLVAGVIGGLAAGMAMLTGGLLRQLLTRKPSNNPYRL